MVCSTRTLCWDASVVSVSYNPDMDLTYVAQTALMAVRVYALYNRNPIVLWVMGTQVVLSVTVCLVLVRTPVRYLQSRGLFNALHQRWVGILGNGMVPGRPPPPVHCVPYNTQKQCALYRALLHPS